MDYNNLRTGTGFDVHAFAENRTLILGGVTIPHDKGLAGHSDADVLTHAIIDALLGASNEGDIGQLFPDTDDSFKDINSMKLLKKVNELLLSRGWSIINIDSTVLCQKPRLSHYKDAMCKNIAQTLNIESQRVSVKATTTEKLGFTGREEGIAVQSSCLIFKKD